MSRPVSSTTCLLGPLALLGGDRAGRGSIAFASHRSIVSEEGAAVAAGMLVCDRGMWLSFLLGVPSSSVYPWLGGDPFRAAGSRCMTKRRCAS